MFAGLVSLIKPSGWNRILATVPDIPLACVQ
jgi:hypothetical protein